MMTTTTTTDLSATLRELLAADPIIMDMLAAVRSLDLPDGWMTAGVVRNRVWDHLHGYTEPTPLNDIDIIYLDPEDVDEASEKRFEAILRERMPRQPWSIKNQTRMAMRNGDPPYRSISQALEHWCETPTTVAVRLNSANKIKILAPFGLTDLFDLIVRPTPFASTHSNKLAQYRERMIKKNWPRQWPRIRVLDL